MMCYNNTSPPKPLLTCLKSCRSKVKVQQRSVEIRGEKGLLQEGIFKKLQTSGNIYINLITITFL